MGAVRGEQRTHGVFPLSNKLANARFWRILAQPWTRPALYYTFCCWESWAWTQRVRTRSSWRRSMRSPEASCTQRNCTATKGSLRRTKCSCSLHMLNKARRPPVHASTTHGRIYSYNLESFLFFENWGSSISAHTHDMLGTLDKRSR
jgi:hypothetical protein